MGRPPGVKNKRTTMMRPEADDDDADHPAVRRRMARSPDEAPDGYNDEDDEGYSKIDRDLIPDGMDWQWVTDKVLGQPFPQRRSTFERKGWSPVPAERYDGRFMPLGHNGEIRDENDAAVLMERPMEYSQYARRKELRRNFDQVRAKESQLRGGDIGTTLDSHSQVARSRNMLNKSYEPLKVVSED